MSAVHTAVHAFLQRTSQTYERLINSAVDDGIAQWADEHGPLPRPADRQLRESAVTKLIHFYAPSLVRMYQELLSVSVDGQDAVNAWFGKNQRRIEQAIEGMLWGGGEAGYAIAAETGGQRINWNLDNSVEHHCADCPVFANGGPYTFVGLPAFPADGTTPCGGSCYCYLSVISPNPDA